MSLTQIYRNRQRETTSRSKETRMDPKFHGRIKQGVFVVDEWQRAQMNAYLRGLNGKEVEAIIRKPIKSKTLQQLRYIHGVVFRLISEDTGIPVAVVKGTLKKLFLSDHYEHEGKVIEYVKSLADLKRKEMIQFIDDCIILAAERWHIVIPEPEHVEF